jgi:hypothetical protein
VTPTVWRFLRAKRGQNDRAWFLAQFTEYAALKMKKLFFCGIELQYNHAAARSIRGRADFTLFRASNLSSLVERY